MNGERHGRSSARGGSDTKELILVEARKLFARRGFNASSMEALVKATGLSKGALYWHFPSKLAIYMEVADREAKKVEAFFTPTEGDTRKGLLPFFLRQGEKYIEKYMVDPDTVRLWINLLGEVLRGNRELEAHVKKIADNVVERLCGHMEHCFPEDARSKRSEFRELGFIVDAVFNGVVLQLALWKDIDRAKRVWSSVLSGAFSQFFEGGEQSVS